MKRKTLALLFTAVFLLLCAAPFLGLLLTGGSAAGANEVLAVKPALRDWDGKLNSDYLAGWAEYINDRFSLRQEAVTAWAGLNAVLFRTSVTDSVLLGREGWLYYAPTLADYARSESMTARELWCAGRTLALLQEYAEAQGGRFLFTLAPNKNSLYPENMPEYPRGDGASNAEVFSAVLDEMGVRYLDLFAVFEAEDETLYFPTDSHWNARGAALAADAILSALGRESGYYAGVFNAAEHKGDLYEMLYPAGKKTDGDLVYAPGFTFTASSQNPDAITLRTQAGGSGSLLCYRDSFGRNLYPYLAESYAHAVFSRKNDYSPLELAPGGTLAVELVERNLRYLNTYAPTLPAPQREDSLADSAESAATAAQLRIANGAPAGYTILHGDYGGLTPDAESPVYVRTDAGLYEAVPQPEGFSICLPAGTAEKETEILFFREGKLLSVPGVMGS